MIHYNEIEMNHPNMRNVKCLYNLYLHILSICIIRVNIDIVNF